jgi:hypothetical protein
LIKEDSTMAGSENHTIQQKSLSDLHPDNPRVPRGISCLN